MKSYQKPFAEYILELESMSEEEFQKRRLKKWKIYHDRYKTEQPADWFMSSKQAMIDDLKKKFK